MGKMGPLYSTSGILLNHAASLSYTSPSLMAPQNWGAAL